jgi:predicted dehydrogenase
MKPVVWGVLGVSGHFRLRLQIPLRDSPLVELRAIASRSLEKAKAAAAEFGMPAAYGSYEELLADPRIEAVYIPLPNHLHAEWVKKAADAGKHVLCEKPFALNALQAAEAIEHARAKGVLVMEAFMYKLHPQWRRVKDLLKVGEIGSLLAVQTYFAFNNRDPHNIRNIQSAGGGALYDIGSYAVSSARFIMGSEPHRVQSLVQRDPDFKTDRLSSAMLDFGGARALLTVSTQSQPYQRVDIVGTNGMISLHLPFNMHPDVPAQVSVTTGPRTRELYLGPRDQYTELFEGFSRAVRGEAALPIEPADAVANLHVLDALFRSEKSGAWEAVG